MNYSTTDTYKMKREIINFSKKFSTGLSAPESKFHADMLYGIVASKSCLLTQISQRLQEEIKKRYTADWLSDHLSRGIPEKAQENYLRESLGIVRDGSRSTNEKNVYCKGYHVTEACVLTCSNHPVSIFF